MRINFKTFKKVKEDVNSATLKNDRGHEITLSKKSLRPHLLKTLTDLPLHLAEGTPEGVQSPTDDVPAYNLEGQGVPTPSPGPQFLDPSQQATLSGYMAPKEALPVATEVGQALGNAIGKYGVQPVMMVAKAYGDVISSGLQGAQNMGSGVAAGLREGIGLPPASPQQILPQGQMEGMAPGGPELASAPAQDIPALPAAPGAQQMPGTVPAGGALSDYQKGINQQISGIRNEAKAIGESAQRQQAIYDERVEAAKQLQTQYQQQLQDLNVERENIIADIKANKINPNQYMESMNSKQRTSTMIGLLLSGAGSGLSHQNNLAMDFLQKQIDRDINAQIKNMDSRNNLLSANMQQFGNLRDAINMTRINMQDIIVNQIASEAARSSYPLAQAKAEQAIGAIMSDSALKARELAASTMAVPTNDPNQIPAYLDALDRVNPKRAEELRARFVPGSGFAQTSEGAKELRAAQANTSSIKKTVNRLREILNTPMKSMNLKLRTEANSLRKGLVGALRVPYTGPGSMAQGERELLLEVVPSVADLTSLDANSRVALDTIENKVINEYESMLQANGLSGNSLARNPMEGKVARNKQGQRIIMKNGKWVPL